MNLTGLLPRYIHESLVCFAFVNYKVVDGAPDIVTCNRNGYMYEIKNKQVIRSLNLHEQGESVSCYYLVENEKLMVFYLVLTDSHRLCLIRRTSNHLKVEKIYDGIKEFEVHDFEHLGFPQIKITFLNAFGSTIYKFPVESHARDECNETANVMVDSLAEELQILNKHIDELTEEYDNLKKICGFDDSAEDFQGILVGSVAFSKALSATVGQKLKVCNKWHTVYGTDLVLGMWLCNVGHQTIHDLEVVINHKEVKAYRYRLFEAFNDVFLFAQRNECRSVKPGHQICAVGSFQVPGFFDSEFRVRCYVTSSNLRDWLAEEVFEVKISDVASKSVAGLEDRFAVEDLMALRTVRTETRVRIETVDLEDDYLESMLVKNLGFTRIKHMKDKLFYCTSTYLNEVFVALQHARANPAVWTLLMYTREPPQVYFLISALYDLLPENTTISREAN